MEAPSILRPLILCCQAILSSGSTFMRRRDSLVISSCSCPRTHKTLRGRELANMSCIVCSFKGRSSSAACLSASPGPLFRVTLVVIGPLRFLFLWSFIPVSASAISCLSFSIVFLTCSISLKSFLSAPWSLKTFTLQKQISGTSGAQYSELVEITCVFAQSLLRMPLMPLEWLKSVDKKF